MRAITNTFHAINSFSIDTADLDRRLHARLSRSEFFGLLMCASMVGIFVWLMRTNGGYPADFSLYLEKPLSPYFYYGYWILPVFKTLQILPIPVAYVIWSMLNIAGAFFAVRVFGGKPLLVLLSYQFFSSLYYGQISGLLAGGLALCWLGMVKRKWAIAGLGFLIALTKYQVGLTLGLCLIWYAGIHWRDFLRMMVLPLIIGLVTLMFYPEWPGDIIQKLSVFPYTHLGITIWYYIGGWSLLFWIPALLLPLSKPQRFVAVFSLCTFTVPYFLQVDLLTLFAFPLGFIPLLGSVGYLFPFLGMNAVRMVAIIPVIAYLAVIIPPLIDAIKKSRIYNLNKGRPADSQALPQSIAGGWLRQLKDIRLKW